MKIDKERKQTSRSRLNGLIVVIFAVTVQVIVVAFVARSTAAYSSLLASSSVAIHHTEPHRHTTSETLKNNKMKKRFEQIIKYYRLANYIEMLLTITVRGPRRSSAVVFVHRSNASLAGIAFVPLDRCCADRK